MVVTGGLSNLKETKCIHIDTIHTIIRTTTCMIIIHIDIGITVTIITVAMIIMSDILTDTEEDIGNVI